MDNFKPRWGASFAISAALHCAIFLTLGLVLRFDPVPEQKEVVEVDLVEMGGGGGGGSPEEESGPDITPPEADNPTLPPPEPDVAEDPAAEEDVHEIAPPKDAASQPAAPSARSSGTGTGSGEGSGEGPGSGSGTGGGTGSGTGTGTGSGMGPGSGDTMGPQLLSASKPPYPESARRNNIEGTARVGLTIESDGSVSSAWIISSSGNAALDDAAVNCVYSWRFVPAKQNGAAITVNSSVPVTFTLHG